MIHAYVRTYVRNLSQLMGGAGGGAISERSTVVRLNELRTYVRKCIHTDMPQVYKL